jgi:hypothetical protein
MPYPPAMLAATDWLRIMESLDKHFGSNAAIDNAKRDEISNYLDKYGVGRSDFFDGAELPRITTRERFLDKHQGALRLLRKNKNKLIGDCLSCHVVPY